MTDNSSKKPTVLTRQGLYDAVWKTPMSRLAAEYGISGNGLAKICDRMEIVYPPRGYWAKKAAGKKTITLRLSEAKPGTPDSITITPSVPITKPVLPAEVQENISNLSAISDLEVSKTLNNPHKIIFGWIKHHKERKEEARRERDPWRKKHLDPGELSETEHRRHRILDTLFKALEASKASVKIGEQGKLLVIVDKEDIEIQLREKLKQIRRPLTEDEKRWSFAADRGWKQELKPNGILSFSIKTYLSGELRSEWTEGAKNTMEELLPEILATLLAAGPLLAEHRRKREERERQRQIAERKRYEEKQRRQREDNRWKRFVDFAHERREVEVSQALLATLKQMDHPEGTIDGKTIAEWIIWVEDNLNSRDPMTGGAEHIFGTIAGINEWNYRD